MKVSVILLTFDHEPYVAQAIEGVLEQETDFDYELVIAEDCSTDGTREICERYAVEHPRRVNLLRRDSNVGVSQNFSEAYAACRGEYVAFLEGDDYWTCRHKLQKQADALNRHSEWAICFHRAACLHDDGTRSYGLPPPRHKAVSTLRDLLKRNFIHTCSSMVRRRLIERFPPWYFDHLPGDWALSILYARHGKIGYLPDNMAVYRVHAGGIWSSQRLLDRAAATIAMLRAVSAELSATEARWARETIADLMLDCAVALAESGRRREAMHRVIESFREQPLSLSACSPVRFAKLAAVLYPPLHGFLKRTYMRLWRRPK